MNAFGFESLSFGGHEHIVDANPWDGWNAGEIIVSTVYRDPTGQFYLGNSFGFQPTAAEFFPLENRLMQTYPFGEVNVIFLQEGNHFSLDFDLQNQLTDTLIAVNIGLMRPRFSSPPLGGAFRFLDANDNISSTGNTGEWDEEPTVVGAHTSVGGFAWSLDTVIAGAFFSVASNAPDSGYAELYVHFGDTYLMTNPDCMACPRIALPPGEHLRFRTSLEFTEEGGIPFSLVDDDAARFRQRFPQKLDWEARCAIGLDFLGAPVQNANNPRGWPFYQPFDTISVESPAGMAKFRELIFQRADVILNILANKLEGQGILEWDLMGAQFGYGNYVGHPELVERVPEWMFEGTEGVATIDSFFRKFTSAGHLIGVTIRPLGIFFDPVDSTIFPFQIMRPEYYQNIRPQIEYAHDRWGCRLFYMDSNCDGLFGCMKGDDFEALLAEFPDILIIPEFSTTRSHASTAPFLSYQHFRKMRVKPSQKMVYPEAFSFILSSNAPTSGGFLADWADLITSVEEGNILSQLSWFPLAEQDTIRLLYEAAGIACPDVSSAIELPKRPNEEVVRLFPNPFFDAFFVETTVEEMVGVRVFSADGWLVLVQKATGKKAVVRADSLQKGTFFVEIELASGRREMKKAIF